MRLVKLCGDDAQDRVDWRTGIRQGNSLTRARTEKIIGLGLIFFKVTTILSDMWLLYFLVL